MHRVNDANVGTTLTLANDIKSGSNVIQQKQKGDLTQRLAPPTSRVPLVPTSATPSGGAPPSTRMEHLSTESTGTGGKETSADKLSGKRNSRNPTAFYDAEGRPHRRPAASDNEGDGGDDSEFDDPIEYHQFACTADHHRVRRVRSPGRQGARYI